ncbi:MAG: iron uptake porin [Cyanobium sp.]
MKLFQQLLLAPTALGLIAPMAASAADLNLKSVNEYASQEQVTSISQFSDVKPTDWAYQALSNLVDRYGCVAGYPSGTFKGGQAMTRYEAAALLNACLDRVTETTDELKRLMKEFQKELAVLRGRVDGLEARVGELEANQFSTTTKLKGYAAMVLGGNTYSGNLMTTPAISAVNGAPVGGKYKTFAKETQGAMAFNYDIRLDLDTSFTGKDLLRTRLRAGNFANGPWNGGPAVGLNAMETAFEENCGIDVDCGDVVAINRLFYQFPIGSGFTATFGARVRQDDMLAVWPSAYPADTVLDIFTYAGAPGTYTLNLGAGAGLWWKAGGFSLSANYVSANGDVGNPSTGGMMTSGAQETTTVQLAYSGANYALAAAYAYNAHGAGLYPGNGTPMAVMGYGNPNAVVNSVGLSAYWSPISASWFPSLSTGWGLNSYTSNGGNVPYTYDYAGSKSQSWYLGAQWADFLLKGNTFGMAFGQPTFMTSSNNGTPSDGNYAWEWWYKLQVTDNISVTPAIYYLSAPLGAYQKGTGETFNNFGGLVKTTFRF